MANKKKLSVLIDGGYLKKMMKQDGLFPDADAIEKVAHVCAREDEEVHRVLYYDCRAYEGTTAKPVSGETHEFAAIGSPVDDLTQKDLFSVRLGELRFRGWVLRRHDGGGHERMDGSRDEHYIPSFIQKGLDVRISLDIASIAARKVVDRIMLLTGDTDLVPAMKYARSCDMQVAIVQLPSGQRLSHKLRRHADFVRAMEGWPEGITPRRQEGSFNYNR